MAAGVRFGRGSAAPEPPPVESAGGTAGLTPPHSALTGMGTVLRRMREEMVKFLPRNVPSVARSHIQR